MGLCDESGGVGPVTPPPLSPSRCDLCSGDAAGGVVCEQCGLHLCQQCSNQWWDTCSGCEAEVLRAGGLAAQQGEG